MPNCETWTPAVFLYGGFGQCVVSGELAEDGITFFIRQLLSYSPDQRQRQFRAPLRRVEYFDGCAFSTAIASGNERCISIHGFFRSGEIRLEPVEASRGVEDLAPQQASLCAGHAQKLGGESPPANLMEVKA